MKIERIEVVRRSGTLPAPARSARREWGERESALLVLHGSNGAVGVGEASPLPGYSPDTIDLCENALRSLTTDRLGGREKGEPVEPWLEESVRPLGPNAPAARFALESALLDLAGKDDGVSVSRLLGGPNANEPIPLAALVQGETKEAVFDEIRHAVDRGIDTIKMKIGRPDCFDEELGLLRKVRNEFGDRLVLRLDANGAWDLVEAVAKLEALAGFAPQFVEQPVVPYLLLKLEDSPVPVAADETLALPGAAERLGLVPACRVLVLKPAVLGGFLPVLRIARTGKALRRRVVVSHLFDGPVALAAAAELALALPATPLACGLDRHRGLDAWPGPPVPHIRECSIVPPGLPGMGIGIPEVRR